jgi:hypothetical protein
MATSRSSVDDISVVKGSISTIIGIGIGAIDLVCHIGCVYSVLDVLD